MVKEQIIYKKVSNKEIKSKTSTNYKLWRNSKQKKPVVYSSGTQYLKLRAFFEPTRT
jgi:hypothetical protein